MTEESRQPIVRSREQSIQLNRLGREWLMAFAAVLRTSQFHDPKNQIFDQPIAILLRTSDEILKMDGRVEFRLLEEQFFLNALWIKPTLSEKDNLFSLAEAFRKIGLGGVTVHVGATGAHWRLLVGIFHSARGPIPDRADQINAALAQGGVEELSVHRILAVADDTQTEKPLPPAAYMAVTTYAKGLAALREFARSAPGEEQITVLRKAQRIVCDMIDIYDKSPALFCALGLFKNFDSYFFHHGVNVLILSVLIGREIGLGRKEAADLGMAALLHDVGKLAIPETILSKESDLTDEEWDRIERHPLDSAKTFLSLGYMNESVAERVLVAYQHHWASRRPKSYPIPRRPMKASLMAEIVAVAVSYDALTTDKTYRASFTPWEAVRILASQSGKELFRKDIVDAFLRVMGPLPVGSWISVDQNVEGLVVTSGVFAQTKHFPLVLVLSPEGPPQWVDTGLMFRATGKPPKLRAKRTSGRLYREALRALFRNVTTEGKIGPEIVAGDLVRPS